MEERLTLNAAIFRTDKVNARSTDPGSNAASTADDIVVLEGEQRIHGMEFGSAGNVTQDWKVFAGYTVLDSDILTTVNPGELGKDLINIPDQTFSVWSAYQLPFNFEVGGGMQFVDTRFANTTNTRKAFDYWTFDAMLAYKVNDHITLRVNAYNLSDQEYIGSLSGGHFVPGPGRSIVASTDFEIWLSEERK